MNKQTIFSGIQPSGNLHIGNYIGAIKQWLELQNTGFNVIASPAEGGRSNPVKVVPSVTGSPRRYAPRDDKKHNELIFCIVDLHAITVYQNPKALLENNLKMAALYVACGLDPKKSKIFIQSENHDHSYLTWIFDCMIPFGWLSRMTQFKDKSSKLREDNVIASPNSAGRSNPVKVEPSVTGSPRRYAPRDDKKNAEQNISVGLFNYPALMAADILLYDTDLVPVGEDQTQHVELARDVAERFNRIYGPVFKMPRVMLDRQAARIMSLQNPRMKMSKSASDPLGTINLLDTPDEIASKVKRAVTDSGNEIVYKQDKPALSNLLAIYSRFCGKPISELEALYQGKTYSQFKNDLTEVIIQTLKPIQERYYSLRQEKTELKKILDEGREFTTGKSSRKVSEVKKAMGLGR